MPVEFIGWTSPQGVPPRSCPATGPVFSSEVARPHGSGSRSRRIRGPGAGWASYFAENTVPWPGLFSAGTCGDVQPMNSTGILFSCRFAPTPHDHPHVHQSLRFPFWQHNVDAAADVVLPERGVAFKTAESTVRVKRSRPTPVSVCSHASRMRPSLEVEARR